MNRQNITTGNPQRQQGVAIIAITVILLLVATIATLMVGRVGLFEQKLTGTDVRSKEVYSAAVGGLEFGVNWFDQNIETVSFGANPAIGTTTTPGVLPADTVANADSYSHTIVYTLRSAPTTEHGVPVVVEVASTATAINDTHVSKTVRTEVMMGTTSLFAGGDDVVEGPPIVVEGCTTNGAITGNPQIVYQYGVGVGVGSTTSRPTGSANSVAVEDCIKAADINAHLKLCDIDAQPDGCKNNQTVSAADALAAGVEFRDALEPSRSLWDTFFGPGTEFKDLLAMEQRAPQKVMVVDSSYPHYSGQPTWNGNTWHHNSGTAAEPVVLYFHESVGCPPVNGGTTIHGLVYYAKADCGNQGWGGGTVYGTVAKSGDLQKFNANAVLISTSLDFSYLGGGDGDSLVTELGSKKFAEVPGSWRDF